VNSSFRRSRGFTPASTRQPPLDTPHGSALREIVLLLQAGVLTAALYAFVAIAIHFAQPIGG
jgi:hypothetical protein